MTELLDEVVGPQGQVLAPVLHAGVAPVHRLSAGLAIMTAHTETRPHEHRDSELWVLLLEGLAATLCGEELEPVLHRAGSWIWVPPGTAHAVIRLSAAPVRAIEVRTDPSFGDDTVLRPDLDELAAERAEQAWARYAARGPWGRAVSRIVSAAAS